MKHFEKSYFVKFFSPRCRYCHEAVNEYERLAQKIGNKVEIIAIDCSINSKSCKDVKGINYISRFSNFQVLSHTRCWQIERPIRYIPKLNLEYNGERTADQIMDFISSNTPSLVFRICSTKAKGMDRSVSLEEFLKKVRYLY